MKDYKGEKGGEYDAASFESASDSRLALPRIKTRGKDGKALCVAFRTSTRSGFLTLQACRSALRMGKLHP